MLRTAFLFFCAVFVVSANAQATVSEQEMGKQIFEALRQKEYSIYEKLVLTPAEYKAELLPMYDDAKRKQKVPSAMVNEFKIFHDSGKVDSLNRFQFARIISDGTASGITEWQNIRFVKFGVAYFKNEALQDPDTYRIFSANLQFTYQNQAYIIYGIMGYQLKNGFRTASISALRQMKTP